ncbi:hypothetical protein ACH8ZP_02375 [Chlamydia pneumoniae]|uniref:DUF1389 domain-containing protein n=4 Tax=Chlamydia pneumoniae TaxID=83558 RepID=A0A0F7XBY3_CHLPN|nr:hypothetical protein [Chlamydia pneumoniae]AAD18621.1 hypothetical protein CPn_0481 [Chlamydia pneumoniae CWL029]CRI32991.1 Uncharacterized protein BN1224_Wien1_A_04980 [Chlamydia pneumoniae]CRI35854.1 Uncharacterized protein BN1224_CM1_A_05010 [Chlamydia pneumoniae]CRI36981.1 Uncharacterized protein BN1224_CV14_A_05000 [Chlamydia pneumoniae]CRI38106.1 Uncharacterized protein BN1224_CV15_B_04290 [Chlamydia pneumoniae]
MATSVPVTSSTSVGEANSSNERFTERTSRMYYAALVLGALSCLIFIAMIVIFPQVGLWAVVLGFALGCLLLSLAIVFAVSGLVLGKTLEPSREATPPEIVAQKEWTTQQDVLGNEYWRSELISLFLRGDLHESLIVDSKDRSLDIDQSLQNILKLEPLSTTLSLLKKDCVHINIILHLVRQWNLLGVDLSPEVTAHAEELLLFLIEEQYYSPDILKLIRYGDALQATSPLMDWADSGSFSVDADGVFSCRREECSPEDALAQFDLLLALENPDRRFLKDSFLTYIWSSSFFEKFLHRHLESLQRKLPETAIDVARYEAQIQTFLSRYFQKLDLINAMSLDWGYNCAEGEKCYESANQRLDNLFIAFSSSVPAMKRLFDKYGSVVRVDRRQIREQILSNTEILENESGFLCSLYEYPLSYLIDWAVLLDCVRGTEISLEDQADYTVCLQGLDSMLSQFASRLQSGQKVLNPRDVLSEQAAVMLVHGLAAQGVSFQGLKALMYLTAVPQRMWLGALPLFESFPVFNRMKEFLGESLGD